MAVSPQVFNRLAVQVCEGTTLTQEKSHLKVSKATMPSIRTGSRIVSILTSKTGKCHWTFGMEFREVSLP